MYKLKNQYMVGQVVGQVIIRHNADGTISSFGQNPANTDAVEFAKWMQEGNRPEPSEEGGTVTDEWVAETIAKLLP